MRTLAAMALVTLLSACGGIGDNDTDEGYNDGYVVGYNSICHKDKTNIIRGTDSTEYRNAYDDGYADGIADCKAKR